MSLKVKKFTGKVHTTEINIHFNLSSARNVVYETIDEVVTGMNPPTTENVAYETGDPPTTENVAYETRDPPTTQNVAYDTRDPPTTENVAYETVIITTQNSAYDVGYKGGF